MWGNTNSQTLLISIQNDTTLMNEIWQHLPKLLIYLPIKSTIPLFLKLFQCWGRVSRASALLLSYRPAALTSKDTGNTTTNV